MTWFPHTVVQVYTVGGQEVGVTEHVEDPVKEWYVAKLDRQLMVTQRVIISMDFTAYLNDQLRGFYKSSYVNTEGETV